MSTEWNAAGYHRVATPQTAWGRRVLDRLPLRGDERVIDAGCGTGRLTAALLERLPQGTVLCVDRSYRMLALAREHLAPIRGGPARFVQADLSRLPLRPWADVVFSTATFHCVPDHPALFLELFAVLRPGGVLLAQCGGAGNLRRIHERASALAKSPAFREHFARWTDPWEFADAETTRGRLEAAGFRDVRTDIEEAPTILGSRPEYTDFVTTVILRPHLAAIPDETAKRRFVAALVDRAERDSPAFFLDYRRLNIHARKPPTPG